MHKAAGAPLRHAAPRTHAPMRVALSVAEVPGTRGAHCDVHCRCAAAVYVIGAAIFSCTVTKNSGGGLAASVLQQQRCCGAPRACANLTVGNAGAQRARKGLFDALPGCGEHVYDGAATLCIYHRVVRVCRHAPRGRHRRRRPVHLPQPRGQDKGVTVVTFYIR